MKLLTISAFLILTILPLAGEDQPSDWVLVARQAQTLARQARYSEAAVVAKRALQLAKSYGPTDSRLASTYHLLGLIYREWGYCAEARSYYSHAVAIWKRQSDPNPRFVFNAMTNLLSLLGECEDYPAAEKAFRLYRSDLERYRTNPLDDARILSIQAVLAGGKNQYQRAETLFRQTLDLMAKTPEAKPLDIAGERSNLAVILCKERRYAESLEESERAIEYFEKAAPRHPVMVASLNNAACSLASLGRKEEAERMFQRALQAASDLYGEDNRITAKIMLSYAKVLRENQEMPAAEAYQKRGSEVFRRSLVHDNGTVDAEELKTFGK